MGPKHDVSAGQDESRQLVLDSYGRLSKKPDTGEWEKIETQWADNRTVIARMDATLGKELSDGVSAWKRNRKRKDWDELLERVRTGVSDGCVVWHTDRLFRQPWDLEKLIDLADKGYLVVSAHGTRNLADPDDRFILRIEVAHAARSSDDTSRRLKRRFAAKREQGVGHLGGVRRFGWPGGDQTWTPGRGETDDDRPEVPKRQVDKERRALRSGTKALLAKSKSADMIADEWNAQGLRSVFGNEFIGPTVRAVLLRPTNAGLVEHDGVLISRMPGRPIVPVAEFERLRAMFAARGRGRTHGEVGRRYVGTGLLRCGEPGCRSKLSAHGASGFYKGTDVRRASYVCKKERRGCGSVSADMRLVDAELRTFVILRLSDDRFASAIEAARMQVADRLSQVLEEIASCEELQRQLSERLGARKISLDAFDRANEPLARDLEDLCDERDELSGGSVSGPTTAQPAAVIAAQWDSGDATKKRAMLTQALGGATLYVDKFRRTGKRTFDRNRLRLVSPDGTTVTFGALMGPPAQTQEDAEVDVRPDAQEVAVDLDALNATT